MSFISMCTLSFVIFVIVNNFLMYLLITMSWCILLQIVHKWSHGRHECERQWQQVPFLQRCLWT